jgi:hypothetical protein
MNQSFRTVKEPADRAETLRHPKHFHSNGHGAFPSYYPLCAHRNSLQPFLIVMSSDRVASLSQSSPASPMPVARRQPSLSGGIFPDWFRASADDHHTECDSRDKARCS